MARMLPPTPPAPASLSGQLAAFLALVASVIMLAAGISALAGHFHFGSNPVVPAFAEARVPTPSQLNPVPVERLVFIILAALTPIALVIAARLWKGRHFSIRLNAPMAALTGTLLVLPFIGSDFAGRTRKPSSNWTTPA
ncbi:hypothetical protein F3J45_05635 [Pantoea sp. Ap-967]|uniref:hypothetical protein n=1 Tax=Pantoea sp. Ap-967 TaxID=2608362 RepID=UPI001420FA94|nr:hypothetical protein [Pantoea sp. Ap-967]NIE73926.1 hypothetical protein [Pantoea sp. Ap-967]